MDNTERIGVFGGTFDPIHQTHIALARAAMNHARLDRVLFVVAAQPPHKMSLRISPAEARFEMVRAALDHEPGMEASDIELKRSGPSYTVDTLRALRGLHPGADLFLIIGYDTLADLPKWYAFREVLSLARPLAVHRPGIEPAPDPCLEGAYDEVPFEGSDLSSTGIRERLREDVPVCDAVPEAALRIIRAEGLYRETD